MKHDGRPQVRENGPKARDTFILKCSRMLKKLERVVV